MDGARLDRVGFREIDAHGSSGLQVEPLARVLPNGDTHDVSVAEKYAGWPPVELLDMDPADVRIDLRPVVTYIGDHLWLKGEQSPFPMPSRARQADSNAFAD
jgi:hypothetical protein